MFGIELHKILEYYAIITLIASPISILGFVILYRKTNMISRIDKFVDRLLGIKGSALADAKPEEKEDKPDPYPNDAAEMSGIACFNLDVDDVYFCRRNAQLLNGNIHEIVWSCDNEFFGEIDERGILKSKKAGTVNIFCARKDDPFASAIQAYSINITPTNNNWFGQWLSDAVLRRMKKTDVLARNIKRKIVSENPQNRTMSYEGDSDIKSMSLQFDSHDQLERGVLVLKYTGEKDLEQLNTELEERFEQVKLKGNPRTQIWIHRLIDESHDEVNMYVYLKRLSSGETVLGISNGWREYGEIEEFLLNLNMTGRMFKDLIPEDNQEKIEPIDENPVFIKEEFKEERKSEPVHTNTVSNKPSETIKPSETDDNSEDASDNEEGSDSDETDSRETESIITPNDIPDISGIDPEPEEGSETEEPAENDEPTGADFVDFDSPEGDYDAFEDYNENE